MPVVLCSGIFALKHKSKIIRHCWDGHKFTTSCFSFSSPVFGHCVGLWGGAHKLDWRQVTTFNTSQQCLIILLSSRAKMPVVIPSFTLRESGFLTRSNFIHSPFFFLSIFFRWRKIYRCHSAAACERRQTSLSIILCLHLCNLYWIQQILDIDSGFRCADFIES